MVKFYCEFCEDHVEVEIEDTQKDSLNVFFWGDIVCKICHLVIATITTDTPGKYRFVKVDG